MFFEVRVHIAETKDDFKGKKSSSVSMVVRKVMHTLDSKDLQILHINLKICNNKFRKIKQKNIHYPIEQNYHKYK